MWGCPWDSCGAEWCPTCTQRLGCGRSPPNSWGPCEWKGCSITVTTILHKAHSAPRSPTEPHSPARWQAAAGQGGAGSAQRAPAASRAPAQPGGRRGLRGSRSAPDPWCAGPAGSVSTVAPRPQHLQWHQETGVTLCGVPLGPPVSQPPTAQPQSEGTMREGAHGGPHWILGFRPDLGVGRETRKVSTLWLAPLGHQREIYGAWSPSLVASCHPCSAQLDAHLQAEAGQHLIGGQDIVHGTTLLPATRCGSPRGKSPPAGSLRGIRSQGTLSQHTAYNTDTASREGGGGQQPENRQGGGSGNGVHTHHGHCTPWPTGAMAIVVVEPERVAVPRCSPLHLHNHLLLPQGDLQPGHCIRGSSGHPAPDTTRPAPRHRAWHPQGHSHHRYPLPSSPRGMQTNAG